MDARFTDGEKLNAEDPRLKQLYPSALGRLGFCFCFSLRISDVALQPQYKGENG